MTVDDIFRFEGKEKSYWSDMLVSQVQTGRDFLKTRQTYDCFALHR